MRIEKYGVTLERLQRKDIELVRGWRNSPGVANYMLYRDHITTEMQESWFDSIDNDDNYYFLIITDGEKIGLNNIKNINDFEKVGESGLFIGLNKFHNSSFGFQAMLTLLDFAFFNLGLLKITAVVLDDNHRAIRFNKALGFEVCKQKSGSTQSGITSLFLNIDNYNAAVAKYKPILSSEQP